MGKTQAQYVSTYVEQTEAKMNHVREVNCLTPLLESLDSPR